MDITQVSTKVDNLQWFLKNIDWSSSDSIQFINIAGFVREDENYGYKIVKITFFPFPVFLNAKNRISWVNMKRRNPHSLH